MPCVGRATFVHRCSSVIIPYYLIIQKGWTTWPVICVGPYLWKLARFMRVYRVHVMCASQVECYDLVVVPGETLCDIGQQRSLSIIIKWVLGLAFELCSSWVGQYLHNILLIISILISSIDIVFKRPSSWIGICVTERFPHDPLRLSS